jgi:hypothetical protein
MKRFPLPTIAGERKDMGFAQSAWEANLHRVIKLSGRDYETHMPLKISLPAKETVVFPGASQEGQRSKLTEFTLIFSPVITEAVRSPMRSWNTPLRIRQDGKNWCSSASTLKM